MIGCENPWDSVKMDSEECASEVYNSVRGTGECSIYQKSGCTVEELADQEAAWKAVQQAKAKITAFPVHTAAHGLRQNKFMMHDDEGL